jgi:serine/threonine protein kinase
MSIDYTQAQGGEEIERSLKLSQQRIRPPSEVPGYEPRRFLGAGAYGEVWVAIDRTTGRQVAIKFYLHRGGLDWSLLSHEVEKLAFLSADRYVVQLLDVGWDAEPPYYVMEYIEHGSLDDRLQQEGRLPTAQATALFQEIAVGLMHSHGKGVLHCDLKPANILLDQDGKPRLADFGQSRLSHEQTPALGTLFYMAPEQADTSAVPDARWDVYSLGAIFYAMLTGHPPHRHAQSVSEIESAPHLEERLARYRRLIAQAAPPSEHRKVRGVDHRLAEIIDRCLVADPRQRFSTVQAVLDALNARDSRRSRRPLMVLGAIGPVLLLSVMAWLAWLWFTTSLGHTSEALTESALQGLKFAAQSVASGADNELESRFNDVAGAARDSTIIEALSALEENPETHRALAGLGDSQEAAKSFNVLLDQLRKAPEMKTLQDRLQRFDKWMLDQNKKSESWFITDAQGVQVARWFKSDVTLGHNYSWRSYFHGGPSDQSVEWRPAMDQHLEKTQLSAAYHSDSSGRWVVAISSPIYKLDDQGNRQKFLGVVGVSFNVTKAFINVPQGSRQFAVLVDSRQGAHSGLILQHPLFTKLSKESPAHLDRFENDPKYRVDLSVLAELKDGSVNYRDPIGKDDEAKTYNSRYLAAQYPIEVTEWEGKNAKTVPSGWVIVVQDPYEAAIGGTLMQLRDQLISSGIAALAAIGVVILGLWWFVIRMLEEPVRWRPVAAKVTPSTAETLPQRHEET